jgi:hypothetical protein
VLALVIAGSFFGPYVPFSSSLAWTAVLLAFAARYVRADRWSRRLGWLLAAALAWGQVAAAHFSDGMAIATIAVVLAVSIRTWTRVRERLLGPPAAIGHLALLVAALPIVNLAVIVPRLAYLPRTSLGLGYVRLRELSEQLVGHSGHTLFTGYRLQATWIFDLLRSPGLYVGAAALALAGAGWASRKHRPMVAGFTVLAVLSYVLSIHHVAQRFEGLAGSSLVADYLHAPSRLRFAAILSLAVLAGYGVEGLRVARSTRTRLFLLAPGVVLLWGGAVLFDRPLGDLGLFFVAAVATVVLVVLVTRRPVFVVLLPVLIGVELVVNGLASYPEAASTFPGPVATDPWLTPPRTAVLLRGSSGRYLAFAPDVLRAGGYLAVVDPSEAPLLANGQSTLFGLREVLGYNPVQLIRYWTFIRFEARANLNYNAAFIKHVRPVHLDLLQVAYVIERAGQRPSVPGAEPVVRDGSFVLLRVPDPAPLASFLTSCRRVERPDDALDAVEAPDFDPRGEVVLDSARGVACGPTAGTGGSVESIAAGPQEVRIEVRAPAAGVALVRNSWDEGWHATVDGRPAPVLHADYLDQGVAVPAGRHVVVLRYDDPSVGLGLLGTALAVALLVGVALVAVGVERRRRPGSAEARDGPAPDEHPSG